MWLLLSKLLRNSLQWKEIWCVCVCARECAHNNHHPKRIKKLFTHLIHTQYLLIPHTLTQIGKKGKRMNENNIFAKVNGSLIVQRWLSLALPNTAIVSTDTAATAAVSSSSSSSISISMLHYSKQQYIWHNKLKLINSFGVANLYWCTRASTLKLIYIYTIDIHTHNNTQYSAHWKSSSI